MISAPELSTNMITCHDKQINQDDTPAQDMPENIKCIIILYVSIAMETSNAS